MKDFSIKSKFADDLTFLGKSKTEIDEIENKLAIQLKKYKLEINKTKTERYEIPRPEPSPPNTETLLLHKEDRICWSALDWITNSVAPKIENKSPNWKDCKLDTQTDIQRRKGLNFTSLTTYTSIFKSKNASLQLKIRTFNAFCASIFLYNSEVWSLTSTQEHQIDSFQRRLLRQVINIRWPKKISNEEIYKKTKVQPWSIKIKRRRLTWLGHLMRLHKNTPARRARIGKRFNLPVGIGVGVEVLAPWKTILAPFNSSCVCPIKMPYFSGGGGGILKFTLQ